MWQSGYLCTVAPFWIEYILLMVQLSWWKRSCDGGCREQRPLSVVNIDNTAGPWTLQKNKEGCICVKIQEQDYLSFGDIFDLFGDSQRTALVVWTRVFELKMSSTSLKTICQFWKATSVKNKWITMCLQGKSRPIICWLPCFELYSSQYRTISDRQAKHLWNQSKIS